MLKLQPRPRISNPKRYNHTNDGSYNNQNNNLGPYHDGIDVSEVRNYDPQPGLGVEIQKRIINSIHINLINNFILNILY